MAPTTAKAGTKKKRKKKAKKRPPMPALDQYELDLAVPFTENFKWKRGRIVFDVESFNAWVLSVLPMMADVKLDTAQQIGEFTFEWRKMNTHRWASRYANMTGGFFMPFAPTSNCTWLRNELDMYQGTKRGYVIFTGPAYNPAIRHRAHGEMVTTMSLTPSEILTQRQGIRRARGNVMMGGLGLGWLTMRVLEKKTVKTVTVVEKEQCIIDFFGKQLAEKFGDCVKFVCGDAFEYATEHHADFDSILFDTWDSYGQAEGQPKWNAIKALHPRTWGWGDLIIHRENSRW